MPPALRLVLRLNFVTVTINEVAADNYMRGRTGRTPATAPMQASDVVRAYLTAMENRQLGEAKTYLADGFCDDIPGRSHLHPARGIDRMDKTALSKHC